MARGIVFIVCKLNYMNDGRFQWWTAHFTHYQVSLILRLLCSSKNWMTDNLLCLKLQHKMTQSKSCFIRQTIYCMQVYLLIIIRFTSLLCCRCCVIVWDNDSYDHYIMANYSMGKYLQCSYIWFIIEVTIRTWLILLAFISIIIFVFV